MSKPPKDNETPTHEIVAQVEGQHADAAERSQQIMAAYGDGLPYERFSWILKGQGLCAQLTEAMFEFGKILIVVKEHEPHGEFLNILERDFGTTPRAAQKLMQVTAKFHSPRLKSNAPTFAHLGKAKLLELMTEDDDALAELAEGGTLLGIDMDAIERMGCRELRKTLRDRDADDDAKDRVSAGQRETIQDLQTQLQRAAQLAPDEIDRELREKSSQSAFAVESDLRARLRPVLNALKNHAEASGIDVDACIAGYLNQIEQALNDIRLEMNIVMGVGSLDDGLDWGDTPPPKSPDTH